MYINKENLKAHVNKEGKGFLAYVDLGKDENGKRIRPKVRGRSEDEAIAKLEQKLIDMGYVMSEENAPALKIIVNQFTPIPDFVKEFKVNYIITSVNDGSISSRTAENYVYALVPFEQYFKCATVGDVTTAALNQFFKSESAIYADASLKLHRKVVGRMFKRAYSKKWISFNPFDSEDFKEVKSSKVTDKIEGFDPEELNMILDIIKGNPIIYSPIFLMLHTGMRTQEVLGLKWGNLDFSNNVIHIVGAVTVKVEFDDDGKIIGRTSILGNTKTDGSTRDIGLTAEAKNMLLEWRKIAPKVSQTKTGENDFVFGYERKGNYTYCSFRDKINDYIEKNSNGMDSMRLHRFRHTVGTLLAAEGRELAQIMRQLGITQEKTLQRYIDKKGNKKIMDGNVAAISAGLSDVLNKDKNSNVKNNQLQAILQEAEKLDKDLAMQLISALLGVAYKG